MPLQATSGAASYDAFGGGVAVVPTYIEDVFSTYLYTGNGSTQTITNGIDLSTKGGLVWQKERDSTGNSHALMDTLNGGGNFLQSNATNALATGYTGSFSSTGFTTGTFSGNINNSAKLQVSWTFREQAKFFDVLTFTGNGSNRTIAHNLGSVPGCIIIKRTDAIEDWNVYHRSLANTQYLNLGLTAAALTGTTRWNSTTPTDTVFSLGTSTGVNASGGTYIAYIFAHDAGGFGLTGTDNVISCGSVTATGGNVSVNLGYEPQWVLVKNASSAENWRLLDNMRGISAADTPWLYPNTSGAETTGNSNWNSLTATGFNLLGWGASGNTYIYIAIRRGPMKVPTTGTSVFTPAIRTGDGATSVNVTNATFPVDLAIGRGRNTSAATPVWIDRLRGATRQLRSDNTDAEAASTIMSSLASQTGWIGSTGGSGSWNTSSVNYIQWYMRRAPSFFDIVCYTGTGVARTVTHNLGVVPELMIVKRRSQAEEWAVYFGDATKYIALNSTSASDTALRFWNNTAPTTSVFTVGDGTWVNTSAATYVAYLFATCAGVSKVGSYTGTGTTKQIDCGFTAGARFVLIKRTDSTGDWYVWDTARGMVAGTDPSLLLNTSDAEVNANSVYAASTGFQIVSTAAGINASGGTYIFLAIA